MSSVPGILSTYDHLSLTTHYLRMKVSSTDTILATGTGFIYFHKDYYYLITNGHNLTGINPETNKRIANHIGFPDVLETTCFLKYKPDESFFTRSELFQIPLYEDLDFQRPKWFVHPKYGYKVDVVAIPILEKGKLPGHIILKPINESDFVTEDYPALVSDDVFVLGYPLNIVDKWESPIWKRGSIATEPMIEVDGLPKVLIDTATRAGMSGSPVIYQRNGFHAKNGRITDDSLIGQIRGFLGVYSGRIGAEDNFKSQLGIVWKKKVIEEILEAQQSGDVIFQSL